LHQPSGSEQAVAAVLAILAQIMVGQVVLVVVQQEAVEEEEHRTQGLSVLAVLAVTASLSFTKSSRYEQSLRYTRWHRPQHHCA
jgi:hypothetical protein